MPILAGLTGFNYDQKINLSEHVGHLAEADWFAMIPYRDPDVRPLPGGHGEIE